MDHRLVFASTRLVCMQHAGVLDHVVEMVSNYISLSKEWTLERASVAGYPRLVLLLVARHSSPLDASLIATICNIGVNHAVNSNQIRVLRAFDHYFPSLVMTEAASLAVLHGHSHIIRWLFERRDFVCWGNRVFEEAAKAGRLSVLRRLYSWFSLTPTVQAISETIRRGHDAASEWLWLALVDAGDLRAQAAALSLAPLRLAKWMTNHALDSSVDISIDSAALRGDLAFVHWAESLRRSTATSAAMDSAAGAGFLSVVEYLHFYRREGCTQAAINNAAKGGHLDVAQWLFSHRSEGCGAAAFLAAAARGDVAMFELLLQQCPAACPDNIGDHAAAYGMFDIVELLHNRGLDVFTVRAMDWAAAAGHYRLLMWFDDHRTEGCTVDAMDGAAANGQSVTVYYLDQVHGSTCTERAMLDAAAGGHAEVVKYLYEMVGQECTIAAMANAIRSGDSSLAKWIYYRTSDLSNSPMDAMDAAVSVGCIAMVCWLRERLNIGCSQRAVDNALAAGHLETAIYAFRELGVSCSPTAFHRAVAANQLYAAAWASSQTRRPYDYAEYWAYFDRHGWSISVRAAAGFSI